MRELWVQANYYFSQTWDGWPFKIPLAAMAAVPGFYSGHLGGDWVLLMIFSAMVFIDLVFGTWLAIKRHRFEVRLFGRWVVKVGTHFFVIFIIGLSIRSILVPLSIAFPLLDLFLGMLICTEALSILRNMQNLELPVPKLAVKLLTSAREKAEQKTSDFFNCQDNDHRRAPRPDDGPNEREPDDDES